MLFLAETTDSWKYVCLQASLFNGLFSDLFGLAVHDKGASKPNEPACLVDD